MPPPSSSTVCHAPRRVAGEPSELETVFVAASIRECAPAALAHLVQIYPREAAGRRHPIGPLPVVVGRAVDCPARCLDESVSRPHARIERGPDGAYSVTDLGSRNGSFVNEVRVGACPLRDGDTLRLGNAVFRFLAPGDVEAGYHEELHRRATLDPLTGIPDRRALGDCLGRAVVEAARLRRPLSVAILDVDHFKAVNDRFGHAAGDAALRAVAAAVAGTVRQTDTLARYVGEEFALVLPDTDPAQAWECSERARRAVAARPLDFGGQSRAVSVSVSVGAAGFPVGERLSPDELLGPASGTIPLAG